MWATAMLAMQLAHRVHGKVANLEAEATPLLLMDRATAPRDHCFRDHERHEYRGCSRDCLAKACLASHCWELHA